jgi:hypothetical protein
MLAVLAGALLRRLARRGPAPLAASIRAAASAMEVLPAAMLWILISHRCRQYF